MSGNPAPAAIIRVHRPELSPEDRERRMELIKKAAANVIIAFQKSKNQDRANT